MRYVNAKRTGIFAVPRMAFYELTSLEQTLRCLRESILEELKVVRLECALEPELDERLLAELQTTLDRIARLRLQSLEIRQRRKELLRQNQLAAVGV